MTDTDRTIIDELNKGEEYWTFREDAERDYVHGLFAYPAMMVPQMQREIVSTLLHHAFPEEIVTIFDPFMGSGTILIEGMLKGCNVIGIDINPLAYLVAKVKTEIYSLKRLKFQIGQLKTRINEQTTVNKPTEFFHIEKWFKQEIIEELDIIKQAIRQEKSIKTRRLFWVILCDTIRMVSNSRSCTYKLYIKTKKAIDCFDKSAIDLFIDSLDKAYEKIVSFQSELERKGFLQKTGKQNKYKGLVKLYLGDTLKVCDAICTKYKPQIIITSPPYGDNATTVTYGQYSILALEWIDFADIKKNIDYNLIANQSQIDKISMGGSYNKKITNQREQIISCSPTLAKQIHDINNTDSKMVYKVLAFFQDFFRLEKLVSKADVGTYLVMTVGNRTVAKQRILMNEIIKESVQCLGYEYLFEFSRRIVRKRMSAINAIDHTTGNLLESMNKEYTLLFKRGKDSGKELQSVG